MCATHLGPTNQAVPYSSQEGVLQQTFPAKGLNDMMGNPDAMQGMLKQQMGGLVPQVGFENASCCSWLLHGGACCQGQLLGCILLLDAWSALPQTRAGG